MKRFVLAAALAAFALAGATESAQAGNWGFSSNFGFTFDCKSWRNKPGCENGDPGYCGHGCLPPQGWSPYYPAPHMFGGGYGYNPFPMAPQYGTFPYHAYAPVGLEGAGHSPKRAAPPSGQIIEKAPAPKPAGKSIEK
jgi:hypothetical protein